MLPRQLTMLNLNTQLIHLSENIFTVAVHAFLNFHNKETVKMDPWYKNLKSHAFKAV